MKTIQTRKERTSTLRDLFLKLTEPTIIKGWLPNIMVAIPRMVGGYFLTVNFGGSKFGMPWTDPEQGLALLQVAEWFPKDVAEFGLPFSVAPVFFAWIAAASEAIGGLFLLLGFQTRLSAFLIMCTMLVAVFFQKWGDGVWNMLPAMGFLWMSMYALTLGSGKVGLDYLIANRLRKKAETVDIKDSTKSTIVKKAVARLSSFLIVLLFLGGAVSAQVRGSGSIVTKTIKLDDFTEIRNELTSRIEIDVTQEAGLSITIDENLIEYAEIGVTDGVLSIVQGKWIQPSKGIKIKIGAPELRNFENTSHSQISLVNLNTERFNLVSSVGEIKLQGRVKELFASTGTGEIDALELEVQKANVSISSFGQIKVNAREVLEASVSGNGKVVYWEEPDLLKSKTKKGGQVLSLEEDNAPVKEVAYVNVTLYNNSESRINIEIQGPKERRFGYGAPINGFRKRKERFPVGTQIYLKRAVLNDRLLVTITEEDAGKTVNLFE